MVDPTQPFGAGDPLVSIVIPCYNAAPMIERCVRSCMSQSYRVLEVILVDNNSSDDSIKMAGRAAAGCSVPFQVIPCPQQGQNHARRHGFARATGQYIQWLDADDELTPDKIANQVALLQSRSDLDIAYGDWVWRFHKGHRAIYDAQFRSEQYDDYLMQLLIDNWRPTMSYLLRRAAADRLKELDAWDPRTPCMADREYYSLAAAVGMRFGYVQNAVSVYKHWSKSQITGNVTGSQRAATARRMFNRLSALAEQHGSDRLNHHHRHLLAQNWNTWRAAPVRMETRDQSPFAVRQNHPNKSTRLTRPQARVLQAIGSSEHASVGETQARKICRRQWRYVVASWKASARPPDAASVARVMAELVGLKPHGPSDTAVPAIPDQTVHGDVVEVSRLLNTGMIFLPMFATIRYQMGILFEELDELGLLEHITPSTGPPDSPAPEVRS